MKILCKFYVIFMLFIFLFRNLVPAKSRPPACVRCGRFSAPLTRTTKSLTLSGRGGSCSREPSGGGGMSSCTGTIKMMAVYWVRNAYSWNKKRMYDASSGKVGS